MAKFARYDARNKKKGRNEKASANKDFRIKHPETNRKPKYENLRDLKNGNTVEEI